MCDNSCNNNCACREKKLSINECLDKAEKILKGFSEDQIADLTFSYKQEVLCFSKSKNIKELAKAIIEAVEEEDDLSELSKIFFLSDHILLTLNYIENPIKNKIFLTDEIISLKEGLKNQKLKNVMDKIDLEAIEFRKFIDENFDTTYRYH